MNLFIESFEGDIYLAYRDNGDDKREYVKTKNDLPQRFNSISQVREHFQGQTFDHVWLKHKTAYDEMIGLPGAEENTTEPLSWH